MIKEPYVSLKEIIIDNPSVANIDESSLMAGVVNASCGPDHLLVQGPKQFLENFTIGGEIPRDADITVINAYFCSFFAPILIKRAWNATDGKVPIQVHNFTTMSSTLVAVDSLPNSSVLENNYLSLKYPVDLTTDNRITVLAPEFDSSESYSAGDIVYRSGDYYQFSASHTGAWSGSDASKVLEFSTDSTYTTGDAVLHDGHLYTYISNIQLTSDWVSSRWSLADDPTAISSDAPVGIVKLTIGITTPDVWDAGLSSNTKSAADYGAASFGFTPTEIENNSLYVVYWYDAALGANATMDESAGYKLVSSLESGINPLTDRGVYFEDVLDSDEIPFNIVGDAFSAGLDKEAEFGDGGSDSYYNNSEGVSTTDFIDAFNWFEENSDVYNISYVSTFGKTGSTYEKLVSSTCDLESTRWFFFCDVPITESSTSSAVITWASGLGISDTYRTMLGGGFDKNPSVTGWNAPIAASSLYWQRVYANKAANSEFAPVFDMTNGTLAVVKPYKQFTKSEREQLLSATYPINWIKYDRTNNVYYLNDNRTHTRKQNVMNEEMNVRMVNKLQRDIMLMVQKYKGQLNNVQLRADVTRLITDYFDTYIMTMNYRPVEYRVVCDETNNTADVINANKLAIEVDVRLQNSIKFINILNKVFPLGIEFEQ